LASFIIASNTAETFSIMPFGGGLLRCGCELSLPVKNVPQESVSPAKEEQSAGGPFLSFVMVLILYVLSTGPVVRLMDYGRISEKTLDKIYAPIVWLDQTSAGRAALEPFFHWYGEKLWAWGSSSKQRP
jgi:hypothetical protein